MQENVSVTVLPSEFACFKGFTSDRRAQNASSKWKLVLSPIYGIIWHKLLHDFIVLNNFLWSRPANPWQRKIWRPMKKNLEILQKIVRFYFLPDQTPFTSQELDTNLTARVYSPFKMADRHGEKRYWTQAKSSVQKSSTLFFVISLSLYGISIPRK